MKPTESRDRMLTLIDETVVALGTTGWREVSGAVLQGCTTGASDGSTYTYTRLGPPSDSPENDVKLVERFWVSKGYTTKLTTSSNPRDEALLLFAVGDAVKRIRFSAEAKVTALSAESVCLPGDISKIIDSGNF